MKRKLTPENIQELKENQIFVLDMKQTPFSNLNIGSGYMATD